MCPELEPRAIAWHLVLLPRPNTPGCGLEISSLICECSLQCSPCVPLICFSWLVSLVRVRSLVLILVSVHWSPQLDQTWGQMKGGFERRGRGAVLHEVRWGPLRRATEIPFWCRPWGHCLMLLTLSPALRWGVIASSGLFSLSFAVSNVGKRFVVSDVECIRQMSYGSFCN